MTLQSVNDFPLAKASTLVQQVHAELKQRIIDGRLEPGADVRDSVIAKQMGVSRAPVRDACALLVQSGLLTKQQNHPFQVREFSGKDLGELQLIRWGYELAAVRHLVRAGTTPTGAEEPIERMVEAARTGDAAASGRADFDFHLALVHSTGLEQLIQRHESLMQQMYLSMQEFPAFIVPTQAHRHSEVLSVLAESQASGSPDAILVLMSAHLLATVADVEAHEDFPRK